VFGPLMHAVKCLQAEAVIHDHCTGTVKKNEVATETSRRFRNFAATEPSRGGGKVRGGKMRGTGARYQCQATGNLPGWNVRGATDNWRSRCRYRM